eukprot:IDg10966t1
MPSACFAAPALLAPCRRSFVRVSFRRSPQLAPPYRAAHIRTPSRQKTPPLMRWSGGGSGGGSAPPLERALSILPYFLPILDSLSFGRFVFESVPALSRIILGVLGPVYAVYRGIPFVAFGVFLALYIFVVRNANVSRFIRFNTFQALMLDIALIIPQLLSSMRVGIPVPLTVVEITVSAVFYAVLLTVGYAVAANLRGRLPDQIPGVSASVYSQMGPM